MAVHHAPSKAHVSSHARACACACASASECVDVSVLVGVCVVPTAGNTECTCNICHVHRGHLHDVHAAEQPVRKQIDVEEIWEERNRLMSEIDVLNFALDEESITSKDHSRRMGHIVTRLGELKDRLAQMSAHDLRCAFWALGYVEADLMMVPDLLHLFDLGLIPRFMKFTCLNWPCKKSSGLGVLNNLWSEMTPCDDVPRACRELLFKKEKKKIEMNGLLKASEYRDLLQLFPNIVRGEKTVFAVWVALHSLYEKAHANIFTETTIRELHEAALT